MMRYDLVTYGFEVHCSIQLSYIPEKEKVSFCIQHLLKTKNANCIKQS